MSSLKEIIDVTFDFNTDTPANKDADAFSQTLRRYHKILWSKPLPNGVVFNLDDTTPRQYLHHKSELGEFFLSSDAMITKFSIPRDISATVLNEKDQYVFRHYTIGSSIVFPSNCIDRRLTINKARGWNRSIQDRFDLTLECIRRHYCNERSKLSGVLSRYSDFFGLFGDFRGYVEFFLLQDMVTADYSAVKFFMEFNDFKTPPLAKSIDQCRPFMQLTADFINARSCRIREFCM